MDASSLLPIEIWTKIIKEYLKLSHWINVQNVCQLFWNIIQDFVALGLIKSDFYDIRRPFIDVETYLEEPLANNSTFVFMNEDKIQFSTSEPLWILGAGFHGPYTVGNQVIRQLQTTFQISSENQILQTKVKINRVKYPEIIQPLFFENPILLQPQIIYTLTMNFCMENSENNSWIAYLIEYTKSSEIQCNLGNLTFFQDFCLSDSKSRFAYVQSGHIRTLYFWPVNKS